MKKNIKRFLCCFMICGILASFIVPTSKVYADTSTTTYTKAQVKQQATAYNHKWSATNNQIQIISSGGSATGATALPVLYKRANYYSTVSNCFQQTYNKMGSKYKKVTVRLSHNALETSLKSFVAKSGKKVLYKK